MSYEVSLAVVVLTAVIVWLLGKQVHASHRASQQRRIVLAGATCVGKVVAVQRPFMLDDCARLYFDFVPEGTNGSVRACHVAQLVDETTERALPHLGSTVTVRYLPEHPQRAVIGKLVAG